MPYLRKIFYPLKGTGTLQGEGIRRCPNFPRIFEAFQRGGISAVFSALLILMLFLQNPRREGSQVTEQGLGIGLLLCGRSLQKRLQTGRHLTLRW